MNHNNKKMYSKSLRDITLLMLIILLLAALVILLVKLSFGTYTLKDFMNDFFNSLMGAIIPLIIFNIAYEYFTRSYQANVMSETIAETLLLDRNVVDRFKPEDKATFIRNCTKSIVGDEEGEMLYSTLLSPYLSEKQAFRKNFTYYIFYSPMDARNSPLPIMQDGSRYCWVHEELSYEKKIDLKHRELIVGFSYNEQKLETFFRNESIIFRENLWLEPELLEVVKGYGEEQLKAFAEKDLQFHLEMDGARLQCLYARHDEDNGFILGFTASEEMTPKPDEYYKIKIGFRMPQLAGKRQFSVILSEPTYGVDILYSNQLENVKVTAIPFFDHDEVITNLPNDMIRIELNEWVLPTSGVVFVWEEKE